MSDFSLLGYKRENSIDQLLDDPVPLDINALISDSIPLNQIFQDSKSRDFDSQTIWPTYTLLHT